jgi:hypothetical protein
MQKRSSLPSRFLLISVVIAFGAGAQGAPTVLNHSFESGGNPPANWSEFDASGKCETGAGNAYDGWYVAACKDIKTSGQGIYQVVSGFSGGMEYEVTCYFRSTYGSPDQINAQILVDKDGGTSVGGADYQGSWVNGASYWQELSCTFTASQNTATIFLRVSADWPNYPYWGILDFVEVTATGGGGPTPTDTPIPPTPTPGVPPTPGEGVPPPICPHVNNMTGDIYQWMQGAPWVKVLDQGHIAGVHAAGANCFFRPIGAGDEGDCYDGAAFGQAVLNLLNNISPSEWPEAIGYRNEFFNNNVTPYQFIPYYNTLRAGGYQGIICYGSYGVGWPAIEDWGLSQVQAAVNKADAIETHEYFDLTCAYWDTWLAHRHVRAIDEYPYLLGKPWFIGEMGSDRCGEDPLNRRGWRDNGKLTEQEYITQLTYYREGGPNVVPPADQVVACFIFQQGAGDWWDFDIMGTSVANWVAGTWSEYVPPPTNTATPTPGAGPTNTPVPQQTPVIQQPSFESSISPWQMWIGSGGNGDGLERDWLGGGAYHGVWVLAVKGFGSGGKGAFQYVSDGWMPGHTYRLGVWCKNIANSGINYSIGYKLGNMGSGGGESATYGGTVYGPAWWTQATCDLEYSGSSGVTIYLRAVNAGHSERAGFDYVTVQDLN